ncbi:Hypothetical predicted protein [Cloeon dipterum]|uniref:Uncharacterized protein n=1 Tax=Cloeon dipterum TaxID=197152 RepID=A0A8S1D8V3_9INSE|nr:Hypothetical predicted protein [Cloeon dipterum]
MDKWRHFTRQYHSIKEGTTFTGGRACEFHRRPIPQFQPDLSPFRSIIHPNSASGRIRRLLPARWEADGTVLNRRLRARDTSSGSRSIKWRRHLPISNHSNAFRLETAGSRGPPHPASRQRGVREANPVIRINQ